jgi:hypothetical protein
MCAVSDHFDSYTLHIAHAICCSHCPVLYGFGRGHQTATLGHNGIPSPATWSQTVFTRTAPIRVPDSLTPETQIGWNQVDVSLGPWPPGLVRSYPVIRLVKDLPALSGALRINGAGGPDMRPACRSRSSAGRVLSFGPFLLAATRENTKTCDGFRALVYCWFLL